MYIDKIGGGGGRRRVRSTAFSICYEYVILLFLLLLLLDSDVMPSFFSASSISSCSNRTPCSRRSIWAACTWCPARARTFSSDTVPRWWSSCLKNDKTHIEPGSMLEIRKKGTAIVLPRGEGGIHRSLFLPRTRRSIKGEGAGYMLGPRAETAAFWGGGTFLGSFFLNTL